jgi:outer membrane protein
MMRMRFCLGTNITLLAILAFTGSAFAETLTLNHALGLAYESNPQLNAQRAALRAVDEDVAKALGGWRPTVTANAGYGYERDELNRLPGQSTANPRGAAVTITQPVFNGQVLANVSKAKALARAGRAQLTAVEQAVLLNAVTADMDVVRDSAIVKLQADNVQVLQDFLQITMNRSNIGEIGRTDVAQAEARLTVAMADLTASEAQLAASRAAFEHLIGTPVEQLETEPGFPTLPGSDDEALAIGLQNNPTLTATREQARAADYGVDLAVGALLPSLSVQGQYQKSVDQIARGIKTNQFSVVAQLTVPIYQAGIDHANVRQASELRNQATQNIAEAERQVRDSVRTAWEALRAARAAIGLNDRGVRANEVAFEGVRQETAIGVRATLDVLNAEQELVNARVSLAISRRNAYVAAYQVLAGTGGLTAKALVLPVKLYDPADHYDNDAGRWFGLGD